MTTIYIIIGVLVAVAAVIAAAFKVGKSSGEDSVEIKGLKAESRLRRKYEDIDNSTDVDDPLSRL